MTISPVLRTARTLLGVFLVAPAVSAIAQSPTPRADSATTLKTITVTATRRPMAQHNVAAPLAVIDSLSLRRRAPNTVGDLFRDLPGVDVVGVGANQLRPAIRGQRGQRILLLQDGLRLGNSRRQQDFGELPALVDLGAIRRIEVVRGPSSVLYGTDAIGGVVNLITTSPLVRSQSQETTGRVSYRYGEAGRSNKGEAQFTHRRGGLVAQAGGALRESGDYRAPAGDYGKVSFANPVAVTGAGVKDRSLNGYLGYRSAHNVGGFIRAEEYRADDAGFGFVEPTLLDQTTRIEILYPAQRRRSISAGINAAGLATPLADRADLTLYRTTNKRDLAQKIFIPFGPGTPPGAGVDIRTTNFTDVTTTGLRAEVAKVFSRQVITYGVDYFKDDASGRDSSLTTVVGFGPPHPTASTKSQVPNASLSSYGVFAQNDVRLHDRVSVVVGGRLQHMESNPRNAGGASSQLQGASNGTGVYAANLLYRLSDQVNLVSAIGKGFRAPNLVERYFDGPTPEGSAYQSATPDLKPERSLNVDVGAKLQSKRVTAEAFVFQNRIEDGIRIAFAGDSVGRLPRYRNINVSQLRVRGAEVAGTVAFISGVTASANWSKLVTKNVSDPALPVGDVYASKLNTSLGYRVPSDRWWVEYSVRRNGRQRDIVAGSSPVGDALPAFVVQNARAGFRLTDIRGARQEVSFQLNNIGNVLYSEVANAGFFRPEPRRHVVLNITTSF